MKIISELLYFLNHHSFWSFLILLAIGFILVVIRGKMVYLVVAFVIAMLNFFPGSYVNALFLNAFGQKGQAIITQSTLTNSKLNNQYISDYDVVVITQDDKDVVTCFSTMSVSIYPIRNEILIPPDNELFYVKYIPGCEKNIVILSDESEYGRQRIIYENQEPVIKARKQFDISPNNKAFQKEYLDALKTFVHNPINRQDSITITEYENIIKELQQAEF
jgi:hypothetical protein